MLVVISRVQSSIRAARQNKPPFAFDSILHELLLFTQAVRVRHFAPNRKWKYDVAGSGLEHFCPEMSDSVEKWLVLSRLLSSRREHQRINL